MEESIDEQKETPYSSGGSKRAKTVAKALLSLPAFKGVSDKDMAYAHLVRTLDKEMK